MIFDTHTHYDDHAYDEDRLAVLSSLAGEGVGRVVAVSASVRSLDRVRDLVRSYEFVYGAAGLHPDEVGVNSRAAKEGLCYTSADGTQLLEVAGLTDDVLTKIRGLLADPRFVAVGEIGLDYHWDTESHEIQQAAFVRQMELAREAKKPILVHSRAAAADTLRLVEEMYGPDGSSSLKGIIHAYAYSLEQARIYTGLGFLLGIGGVVTYKTSKKLKKVVEEIPLAFLVLETDCPYLTPEPYRGTRNSSAYLHSVVRAIAEIKGVTEEEVERVTWENACRLFQM